MPRGVYDRTKSKTAKETAVADEQTNPEDVVDEQPDTPPTPPAEDPESEICGACWPTGWPDEATYAGCEHGQWARE